MTSFILKIIAVTTMLIDHIAVIFIPMDTNLYLIMRLIGRIAFPIFAFLLAEGLVYTKNVYKYMARLGMFALLSEIPFDLALFGNIFYPAHQNVFFTLLIGLAVIYIMKRLEEYLSTNYIFKMILQLIAVIAGCMLAEILRADYGSIGIVMIMMFYLFHNNKMILSIAIIITGLVIAGGIEAFCVFSLIPILLYNGKQGNKKAQYFFYLFYPVHLLVLSIIYRIF